MNRRSKPYMVDGKPVYLAEQDWDILFLLDACRYDVFKKVYKDILGDVGEVKLAVSPVTWTLGWVIAMFGDVKLDDVVYISSNSFVNSKGLMAKKFRKYNFDARKHFKKIIDVWDWGYNKQLGTIPPSEVNKGAIVAMDLHPRSRFLVHYMQPHAPYVYYGVLDETKQLDLDLEPLGVAEVNVFRDFAFDFMSTILPTVLFWKILRKTGRRAGPGEIYFKYGWEGIRKGYEEDVKLVLQHIKKIMNRYPNKKVLIVSDHGERLGEKGKFGHGGPFGYGGLKDRIVTEVPWLEIEKTG